MWSIASHIKNKRKRVLSGTRNNNCNTNIPHFQVKMLSRAQVIMLQRIRTYRIKHMKQGGRTVIVAYLQKLTEGIHKRIHQDSRSLGWDLTSDLPNHEEGVFYWDIQTWVYGETIYQHCQSLIYKECSESSGQTSICSRHFPWLIILDFRRVLNVVNFL